MIVKCYFICYFWEPNLDFIIVFLQGLSGLSLHHWNQRQVSGAKRKSCRTLNEPRSTIYSVRKKYRQLFHEFCTFRDFTSFWMCIFFLCVILSVHILTYELSLNYDNYLIGFQILLLFLFKLASNKNHVYLSFFVTCSQQIEHKSFTIQ